MKENIPLSWSHKYIEFPKFHSIKLPLSGLPWVHTAEIPADYSMEDLFNKLESNFPVGFLLRGCGSELAGYLNKKGYGLIRTGAEGVVNLDCLTKLSKSLTELVKRGSRWGRVKEISLSELNRQTVSEFINHTPYGSKPHLRYLFVNTFNSSTRCFVIRTSEDEWLGVMTVSAQGENCLHTEMVLRNKKAPVGVMESLFISVMNILRDEGLKHFSLGEVPFVSPEGMEESGFGVTLKQSIQESFLFNTGHLLRFAYNYKGLFDFKNKFDPEWKPVYICATPKLPFLSLIDLFCKTGYFDLLRSQLIANIKTYSRISTSAG